MSDTTKPNDGGPAFLVYASAGLSKREWFEGMALAGLCQGYHDNEVIADTIAANASDIADAMIEINARLNEDGE